MNTVTLVSEKFIKDNTPVGWNVDNKDLTNNVLYVQDSYVQETLGTDLYNKVLGDYASQSLTGQYYDLVQKLQPAIAWKTLSHSLPWLMTHILNKGPVNMTAPFSMGPGDSTIKGLIQEASNRAEFYMERVEDFLCASSSVFPEYNTNNNSDIHPHDQEDNFGFII